MKKLILLLLSVGLLMAEVEWRPSYDQAQAEAKKAQRPILVLLVSHTCHWCRKLENRTLQNPEVVEFINTHFVPVLVYREDGGYPDTIHSSLVPTTFYLTPEGKYLLNPKRTMGYMEPMDYMSDMKLALKKFNTHRAPH